MHASSWASCSRRSASTGTAQSTPGNDELELVRQVVKALKLVDGEPLQSLIDAESLSAERLARGMPAPDWSELDEAARLRELRAIVRPWIRTNAKMHGYATLIGVSRVEDPDAGLGPVPGRRMYRATVRNQVSGQHLDLLVVATPELALLDVIQGEPYEPGANPAGPDGLKPTAVLSVRPSLSIAWPDDVDADERANVSSLVDTLLAAPEEHEAQLAAEYLHRNPHAGVAVLMERLIELDGEERATTIDSRRLTDALRTITGHDVLVGDGDDAGSAGPGGASAVVTAWARWHERNGRDFVPAEITDPIDPAVGDGTGPEEQPELDRWSQRLLEQQREARSDADGETGDAADGANPTTLPAEPEADAPGNTSGGRPAAPPPLPAQAPAELLLHTSARESSLLHRGKRVIATNVEDDLSAAVRRAINTWTEPAERLGFRMATGRTGGYLVIGRGSDKELKQATDWLDEAWTLLDPLVPTLGEREPRATVVVLLDEGGMLTEPWGALVDEFVGQRLLSATAAQGMRDERGGVTLRHGPLFVQPTYDMAGNAAAGDDEFRLGNELVHKFAQCLLTARTGQQPANVMWGLGYLVEHELYESIYQFDSTGFVATQDHFNWPERARESLESRRKAKGFSLGRMAAAESSAGRAQTPQMLTWASMTYLARQDREALADMLSDLAEVQRSADRAGLSSSYRGDEQETLAVLQKHLDGIDARALAKWLERL